MKSTKTAMLMAFTCLSAPAFAQQAPAPQTEATEETEQAAIVVTGSRIKRDPNDSSLPLTVITATELSREGINSPEQLISLLSTNGNGADNLASNSDVTSGAQRGTNGLSSANLRGQGAGSTLVLLNGRRVAAHGLTGSAVDVNQIPFAAIERIEVLKDGASAIYGTDAIGGVHRGDYYRDPSNGYAPVHAPRNFAIGGVVDAFHPLSSLQYDMSYQHRSDRDHGIEQFSTSAVEANSPACA